MLELKLVKDSLFFNLLEAILDLVDVANIDWSSTGLTLQAVDTEHVVVIVLHIPAVDLQHYNCDEYIHMGIPIDDMVKAIRCADKDDTITIKLGDEDIDDTVTLSIESPKKKITTACNLQLVNASSQRFHIPDWQVLESKYQAFVKMPSAEFMSVCKYLSSFSDDGSISVTEKVLKFFASGKIGRGNIKYMQPEATATVVNMRSPVSLTLDLKYMNSFAKACTLFNQVRIGLSTTHPLMVECNIGQMGYIRYFQAPKLKTEIEEEKIKTDRRGKDQNRDRRGKDQKKKERDRRGRTKAKGVGSEKEKEGSKRERER